MYSTVQNGIYSLSTVQIPLKLCIGLYNRIAAEKYNLRMPFKGLGGKLNFFIGLALASVVGLAALTRFRGVAADALRQLVASGANVAEPTRDLPVSCTEWADVIEHPTSNQRTAETPFWLLPKMPLQYDTNATIQVAIVVPPVAQVRVWRYVNLSSFFVCVFFCKSSLCSTRRNGNLVNLTRDYGSTFPPGPDGSLPDEILVHLEERATGAVVSVRPLLCPSLRFGSRMYTLTFGPAVDAISRALNPASASSASFTATGLVLLRNWSWNCVPPACPQSYGGGGRELAEDVRTPLPDLPIRVGPSPTSPSVAAVADQLGVPCDTADVLVWRYETPGPGGCGLGCDGTGYALGPPSCRPMRAPAIQALFKKLGYTGGIDMLGDSNMRRAHKTLSGVL
jgi:hypothetical protein